MKWPPAPVPVALLFLLAGCGPKNSAIESNRDSSHVSDLSKTGKSKNYRFSVVPGGVHTADELEKARSTDAVVRVHYQDLSSRFVRLAMPHAGNFYVSYRIQNKIYWTRHPAQIPKGEPLLTDGEHLVRVRCGNRLSIRPMGPIQNRAEPTPTDLDQLEPLMDLASPLERQNFPYFSPLLADSPNLSMPRTHAAVDATSHMADSSHADQLSPAVRAPFDSEAMYPAGNALSRKSRRKSRAIQITTVPEPSANGLVASGLLVAILGIGTRRVWQRRYKNPNRAD